MLTRFGLTGLNLDIVNRRFEYEGGAVRAPVRLLPPGHDPAETVRAEIERELNAPFTRDGRIDPFRFFALDRGGSFDLGLAYDHFIAAGDSIVALMKAIAEQYGSGAATSASGVPNLYPPTYGRLFLRQMLPLLIGLRRIPANVASFRRAFRPRYPYGNAGTIAFTRVGIGRTGLAALRQAAKAWDVTVNDLMLAMLLQTLSPLTEERRGQSRRKELAVASIVNIRGDCGAGARGAFGQFLSSFHVAHPVPPGMSLKDLARAVRVDTARVKREKLYLQTLFAMAAGGLDVAIPVARAAGALPRQGLSGMGRCEFGERRRAVATGGRRNCRAGVRPRRADGPAFPAGARRHHGGRDARNRHFVPAGRVHARRYR